MKTNNRPQTRLARFETLEPRQMLCELIAAMPVSAPPAGIEDVAFAEVAKPIALKEIDLALKPLTAPASNMPQAVHAVALNEILGERANAASLSHLIPPTDGIGDVVRGAWNVVKSLSPAALIAEAMAKKPFIDRMERQILANAAKINIADMRPGDVLVFSGDGVVRGGIKFLSASNFNHAAIYLGGDKLQVIDATDGQGVSVRSLDDAVRDQNIAVVLRIPGLTAEQMQKIVQTAMSWEGASYSYKNLWPAASGFIETPAPAKPGAAKPGVICSEFVQKVFRENGFTLANRNFPSPGDLLLSGQLKAVGLIKTDGWNPVNGSGCY